MMKVSVLLLVLSACSLSMVSAQQTSGPAGTSQSEVASEKKEPAKRPIKLPAEIKLILEVEELPGRENPKSFWEAGYEIRIVDWRAIVERTRTGGDVGDAGLLLLQSSFAHRSLSEENRRLAVALPVNGSLLERLKQQPQNPQAFSLRSTVRLYDAQLDRNYAFKVDRVWQFKLFPDGEATIVIKIKPDGAFSVWGPNPKTLPPGYTIVGLPADVPPTRKP